MTAPTTTPPTADRPALWPQPISVIGLTGEVNTGKTAFAVTIDPASTIMYDLEQSGTSYNWLPFRRIDVPTEMLRAFPRGHKPIEMFTWWRDHLFALKPGQYRVIVLDPAEKIEAGLIDWVRQNPAYFGKTSPQFAAKNGAMMWGAVTVYWTQILTEIAARCETFAFTVHLGDEYNGERKTGKRTPKGKTPLLEMASLYLWLDRPADPKGNRPAKPCGIVLKQRLNLGTYNTTTGEITMVPALPPRLPEATPVAIRQYMLKPPDYAHLRPEEIAPEVRVAEEDLLAMRVAAAEAERDTESLKLERERQNRETADRRQAQQLATQGTRPATHTHTAAPAATNGHTAPTPAAAPPVSTPTTTAPPSQAVPSTTDGAGRTTPAQMQTLGELRGQLFDHMQVTDAAKAREVWSGILGRRNVTSAADLTTEQAEALIVNIRNQLHQEVAIPQLAAGLDGFQSGNGQ